MQRRTVLQFGIGGAVALALAGTGAAWLRPAWDNDRLTPRGREVFAAIARAVLDGALPLEPGAVAASMDAHLTRLDATIAGFPAATQNDIALLLALLASPPGRIGMAGLMTPWADANVAAIQASMQSMRTSSLELRMQAYHALRDLTNAAYYADDRSWAQLGYPGPRTL